MAHGNYVALFDVLGFEDRLNSIGLRGMLSRYEALIESVNYRATQIHDIFGTMGFSEAPYWAAGGDVFLFTKTHGTYASDSILIWSNRTWTDVENDSDEVFRESSKNPEDGWKYHPVPCDNFLDVCSDLMCRGIEVGLPLRGAIAIGEAVLDPERKIFIGKPIVEAARLESGQNLVGASFCSSKSKQHVPPRYLLAFDRHIKESHRGLWGGAMLDWPRHWRRTRRSDLKSAVSALNTNPAYSKYYENTIDLVNFSEGFATQHESLEEISIRTQYQQFAWSNTKLSVSARAVRMVPVRG